MASLYIKDPETARLVTETARRLGTTKTEVVRRALTALEAELPSTPAQPVETAEQLIARVDAWRREHLPHRPTGLKADKAFYDSLYDDE